MSKMEKPIYKVETITCPSCEGYGSKIGLVLLSDGTASKGVGECRVCRGKGKVTEARYQERKDLLESLGGDPDEGEEWKYR